MTHPTLKAGEATYQLEISWNTLCDLEERFGGIGIFQVVALFSDGTRARLTDFQFFVDVTIRDADGKRLPPDLARTVANIAGPVAVTDTVAKALAHILALLGTSVKTA